MAVHPGTHPSADVLRAFGLGKLDETMSGVVLRHLDECEDCRREVSALTNDDFLVRLRQAHGREATATPGQTFAESIPKAQPPLGPTTLFTVPPELANHPDYEVLRELGHGGMGVVYLARHRLSGRMEVLKVMNKALLGQADSKERFLREIQSAARLDHKNVVKMYTALELGALMVLVMEYVPGEDLAQVVTSRGPLPVLNACFYVQQAALGLQHAFEKGMIHRDIKPQNLILAREGRKHTVKILDFGLAKASHGDGVETGLTGTGAMMGTPGYVAPEQSLDAGAVDIRADIYSLGCTLYHLLSGAPPFSGRSLFEILQAHHTTKARPLNQVRPEVPASLAAVVQKMMAKDAGQRYQTPAEVVKALEPFVKGTLKPIPAPAEQRDGAPPPVQKTVIEGQATMARGEVKTPARKSATTKGGQRDTAAPVIQATMVEKQRPDEEDEDGGGGRWKKLLVVSLVVVVLLAGLGGLGAYLVVRLKTSDGILVVEVNEPDAVVYVDGGRATVSWSDDGQKAEVRVRPGTHKVEVKKDGFIVWGEEVELQNGKRRILTAQLVRLKTAAKGGDRPPRGIGVGGDGEDPTDKGGDPPPAADRYEDIDEDIAALERAIKSGNGSESYIKANGRKRSLRWRVAAEHGSSSGQILYGRLLELGTGGPGYRKNPAEAVRWYRKAADAGNVLAQLNLGFCYLDGTGVLKNEVEGVRWIRKAADAGYAPAQNSLGYCYMYGTGVAKDEVDGLKWYRKAADQGNAMAQNNIGVCYRDGTGVAKDEVEAVRWFSRAIEQECALAQNNLGVCYRDGTGVAKDEAEAVRWFRKGAEQGNALAQLNLGTCYQNGTGVAKEVVEAVKWFRKGAEQGNARAQQNLGCCYRDGSGVTRDVFEAAGWFRKSAEQGDDFGQSCLGECYRDGNGVTQDEAEAAKWFRKSAEQGNAYGQYNLGTCYDFGRGVAKDETEAVKWYRKAADQGHLGAITALALKSKK